MTEDEYNAKLDELAERLELAEIANRVLREKIEGISNRLGSFQIEMDRDRLR
jgi:hypothetical protein